jgi:hypothetical protein
MHTCFDSNLGVAADRVGLYLLPLALSNFFSLEEVAAPLSSMP